MTARSYGILSNRTITARPPRGGGCTEPYVTGAQLITDDSFELQAAHIASGPSGEDIGGEIDGSGWPLSWADGSNAQPKPGDWSTFTQGQGDANSNRWKVSTANPRTGTYHMRYNYDSSKPNGNGGYNGGLMYAGREICGVTSKNSGYPTWRAYTSARVIEGSSITWSAYARTSTAFTVKANVYLEYYDQSLTWLSDSGNFGLALGGSYQQYSHTDTAPADAYWMACWIYFTEPPFTGLADAEGDYDVDDATLGIT